MLLPGRTVGWKEDEYLFRQSLLTSDHLDTPMVRTGPPKGTDVVRWRITDNVHQGPNHPQALVKPNPKEMSELSDFCCCVHLLRFTEIKQREHFDFNFEKWTCFFFSFVVPFPLSLRLDKLFFDNLSRPESKEAEQLRSEVADNVSVFGLMAGTHMRMCEMHNYW